MLEVVAFTALFSCTLAMLGMVIWIGRYLLNEFQVHKMNQAVLEALSEGSYRNSYRYRPRKAKAKK